MAVYHLAEKSTIPGAGGIPVCKTRGRGNRFNVVTVSEADFKTLSPEHRCSKCEEKEALVKRISANFPR